MGKEYILVDKSTCQDIANAIRAKDGTSAKMSFQNVSVSSVNALSSMTALQQEIAEANALVDRILA